VENRPGLVLSKAKVLPKEDFSPLFDYQPDSKNKLRLQSVLQTIPF
jgi:hypothetical protein